MLRSIEVQSRRYPSFGKCVFCLDTENLTDEHVIPEALSGIGQVIIEDGSCSKCNAYANKAYEQDAFTADFLPIRNMLGLRRKPRGKKQKPRRMPLVSYADAADDIANVKYTEELPIPNYPRQCSFVVHEPAGKLAGVDRSAGHSPFIVMHIDLGPNGAVQPYMVGTKHLIIFGAPEMVVAKMAYCYAVAERGLEAFDTTELLDLLKGRRMDVFNFVGKPIENERLAMLRLHKFYFRKRGNLNTVIVHLFASFGGPIYEVVIGPDR
ncbi:hypothetical protein ELH26_03880 [Rhizobium leguminosarum]|uniref:hypothetical protein n=1 Tax=Rhizobium leguminosarum TaxID=384 RepID=UPI00103223C3|nr:hypothetical protein [Rhizobium leguminosarum]TBC93219.1 hypothetical protein ELH26_03880 [Rhizobium leguminosarum]